MKLFGAQASVYIKTPLEIEAVALILADNFQLEDFEVVSSEWPPYEKIASFEVMGFEGDLENYDENGYQFHFSLTTEHSFQEIFDGNMHDLSPWLARFIHEICKFDVGISLGDEVVKFTSE